MLARDGVVCFALGQYENYVSPELARMLSSACLSLEALVPQRAGHPRQPGVLPGLGRAALCGHRRAHRAAPHQDQAGQPPLPRGHADRRPDGGPRQRHGPAGRDEQGLQPHPLLLPPAPLDESVQRPVRPDAGGAAGVAWLLPRPAARQRICAVRFGLCGFRPGGGLAAGLPGPLRLGLSPSGGHRNGLHGRPGAGGLHDEPAPELRHWPACLCLALGSSPAMPCFCRSCCRC